MTTDNAKITRFFCCLVANLLARGGKKLGQKTLHGLNEWGQSCYYYAAPRLVKHERLSANNDARNVSGSPDCSVGHSIQSPLGLAFLTTFQITAAFTGKIMTPKHTKTNTRTRPHPRLSPI